MKDAYAWDLIQLQDEILQILYWMRGEHLSQSVSIEELIRFLPLDRQPLREALARLEAKGHLSLKGVGDHLQVLLSETGFREGRRRFEDEFEGRLGHESHLVCDDPDCDCHDPEGEGFCRAAVH